MTQSKNLFYLPKNNTRRQSRRELVGESILRVEFALDKPDLDNLGLALTTIISILMEKLAESAYRSLFHGSVVKDV